MKLLILAFFLVHLTQCLYRSDKFTKIDTPESYKQFSDISQNLPKFYYYLRFTQNFEQYEFFCSNLLQELERFTNIREFYFALKVLKELRCKLNPETLIQHYERLQDKESSVGDASHAFRTLVMMRSTYEKILNDGCNRFSPYLFKDTAKTRITHNGSEPLSFKYSAVVLRDLRECGMIAPDYGEFATSLARLAITELTDLTKEQSAWLTEDTLYNSMDILISILQIDRLIIPDNKLNMILRFINVNLGNDLSLREKNKWNQLVDQLATSKIQIIEIAESFDFNACEDTCYMPIVGLPEGSKVTAILGGQNKQLNLHKTNVIMSDFEELKNAKQVTLKVDNPKVFIFPSIIHLKIRRENKILLTRMSVSSQRATGDLMDSDESECAEIGLAGNEGSFLHVGFRLRNPENFAFVYLQPHQSELETSTLIHAEFQEDSKLFVASMDFSDYETIRPNSGTYNIWISIGNNQKQCGQITLTFTNSEKVKKESLTKAYANELTNIPMFIVQDERFVFSGLYFIFVAIILAVAYFKLFAKLKGDFEENVTNEFWQMIFLGGLGLHVASLVYLLSTYKLIDKVYVPLLQLGVLTFLFAKAFLKR